MKFGDMFRTALENLGRRKVRTVLTSTGVIVGILTIVTMVSLGVGVQEEINAQFAALGLENVFVRPGERSGGDGDFFTQFAAPAREQPITPEVVEAWRQRPDVESVTPRINLVGEAAQLDLGGGQTRTVNISSGDLIANPFRAAPTALAGTIAAQPGQIVIAAGVLPSNTNPADLVGREVTVTLRSPRGESERFPLRVAGVSSAEENEILVDVTDQAAMKSWWFNMPDYLATQGYDQVVVRAVDTIKAAELVRELRTGGYRVESLELILDQANRVFAVINVMLSSVGGLALFVASLGIVNTMIMAIYERTREIGTLKAIGASRGDIRTMFMLEAGLIGLMGGLVGIIGGWLVGILLNRVIAWYIEQEQLPINATFFVTPWWLGLAALGFAALVGILAGLYPAARAARLDPLVALRYE